MNCADCKTKECRQGKDCTGEAARIASQYIADTLEVARTAAYIEATYYMQKNRLEELIEFARMMEYRRLGIAFCIGLSSEAERLQRILEKHFEVHSVCCKVCGIDKTDFDFPKIKKYRYEATCNPIGQAVILNNKKTDLNIIFGLCIGHDVLFSKYSKAPVTALVVKDRVLAHNPIGVLNSRYYRRKIFNLNTRNSLKNEFKRKNNRPDSILQSM